MFSKQTKMKKRFFAKLIISGTLISLSGCGLLVRSVVDSINNLNNSSVFRQGMHGELSTIELDRAKIAWKYFENNYNSETGLVSSVDFGLTTTMWDIADYLAALDSARHLEVITSFQFNDRLNKILAFLNSMSLFENKLPNRYYNVRDGEKSNLKGEKAEIGWSVVDIGRLLIWLKIFSIHYPNYSEYIDKVILRWNYCDLIDETGALYSGTKINNNTEKFEESRIGLEEYIAKGFKLWGFSPDKAAQTKPSESISINGIKIVFDKRNLQNSKIPNSVTSVPYILEGLEFNWDNLEDSRSMDSVHSDSEIYQRAENIYKVQESRYINDHIFTARADYWTRRKTFKITGTIFAEGYQWNNISETGEFLPTFSMISTKAVFGIWSLWKTDYSAKLMDITQDLYDPQRGWLEGRYEQSGAVEKYSTMSTNSMVLESLFYKSFGKIYSGNNPEKTYYDIVLENEFKKPSKRCLPVLK